MVIKTSDSENNDHSNYVQRDSWFVESRRALQNEALVAWIGVNAAEKKRPEGQTGPLGGLDLSTFSRGNSRQIGSAHLSATSITSAERRAMASCRACRVTPSAEATQTGARQNRASLPRRRLLLGREGQTAFQGISGAAALSIRAAYCR